MIDSLKSSLSIDALPTIILELICNSLSSSRDLINLCLANSRLNSTLTTLTIKLHWQLGNEGRRDNSDYHRTTFTRSRRSQVNFGKMVEHSEQISQNRPNWRLTSLAVHLAKLASMQQDQSYVIDIRERLCQFLTLHPYLTSLTIEASANYYDGPFQQLQPHAIIQSCLQLKKLCLRGRTQVSFVMWEKHNSSSSDSRDSKDQTLTNLEELEMTYILPVNLPELIEHSPRLKNLHVLDKGCFPPYERKPTFNVFQTPASTSDQDTLLSGRNLVSLRVVGMVPIGLDSLLLHQLNSSQFGAATLKTLELDLDFDLMEDPTVQHFTQNILPVILQRLIQLGVTISLTSLTLGVLTQSRQFDPFLPQLVPGLEKLSLKIDLSVLPFVENCLIATSEKHNLRSLVLHISTKPLNPSDSSIDSRLMSASNLSARIDSLHSDLSTVFPNSEIEISTFTYPEQMLLDFE